MERTKLKLVNLGKIKEAVSALERKFEETRRDDGERVCRQCGGHAEHYDGCPIGELWEVINEA